MRDFSRPKSDFYTKRAMTLYDERMVVYNKKTAAGYVDSRHVLNVK